jgi:hypothetical protein
LTEGGASGHSYASPPQTPRSGTGRNQAVKAPAKACSRFSPSATLEVCMVLLWGYSYAALVWLLGGALPPASPPSKLVPANEELRYHVEWRLIHAGNARLTWAPSKANGGNGYQANLELESVGLVSKLYKVNNHYSSQLSENLCVESSLLKTNEGSKKRETSVTFDSRRGKASYLERDLVKNTVVGSHEIDIQPCSHDVIGALYQLRTQKLEPGETVHIPISDGKKSVLGRVDVQQRDTIRVRGKSYKTIRYEAHLFNNVLYRRRGRLFVWLTDDDRKLPVRIRVRLPFYIGTVTLELVPDGGNA